MVRRVSGMALLRYVFRSVSIWKGREGRCLGAHRQGVRLARVTKDGTDASVLQDSDYQSESVLPEGHGHFKDEDRPGPMQAANQRWRQGHKPAWTSTPRLRRRSDFPKASCVGDQEGLALRRSDSVYPLCMSVPSLPSHADIRTLNVTYRLDGFQQPDAKLLDAAVGVGEFHKGLARSWLGLPHPNHGEHVPKGCTTSLP